MPQYTGQTNLTIIEFSNGTVKPRLHMKFLIKSYIHLYSLKQVGLGSITADVGLLYLLILLSGIEGGGNKWGVGIKSESK